MEEEIKMEDEKSEGAPRLKAKAYLTYKERQEQKAAKAMEKELRKKETPNERDDRIAIETRVKRQGGSLAYAFTTTGGAKRGEGRTIVNPPAAGPVGKAGKAKAVKAEIERVKTVRARKRKEARG